MNGQHIGYVRVSTLDQSERRQLEGQVLDRIYSDKASGRDTERPTFGLQGRNEQEVTLFVMPNLPKTHEIIQITRHGHPSAVLMSAADLIRQPALCKLVEGLIDFSLAYYLGFPGSLTEHPQHGWSPRPRDPTSL